MKCNHGGDNTKQKTLCTTYNYAYYKHKDMQMTSNDHIITQYKFSDKYLSHIIHSLNV